MESICYQGHYYFLFSGFADVKGYLVHWV